MAKIGEAERLELERIREADPEKLLKPEAVVEAARDEASPLHAHMEWDDTAAAHAHRLAQARALIRVVVTVFPGFQAPVRAYVSLPSERGEQGGYRRTDHVLAEQALRRELLAAARRELAAFQRKYSQLEELAQLFAEANKVLAS